MFVTMRKRENMYDYHNNAMFDYIISNIDRIDENATVDDIISIVNYDIRTLKKSSPMSLNGECGFINKKSCSTGMWCSGYRWCGPESSHRTKYENHDKLYSNKVDKNNDIGKANYLNLVKEKLNELNNDSIKELIKEIKKMKGWGKKYSHRGLNYSPGDDGIDGCRKKADELGVKGFTYRTNKHPEEHFKNTCFFYDDLSDWTEHWVKDETGAHISACTNKNYKWPCNE